MGLSSHDDDTAVHRQAVGTVGRRDVGGAGKGRWEPASSSEFRRSVLIAGGRAGPHPRRSASASPGVRCGVDAAARPGTARRAVRSPAMEICSGLTSAARLRAGSTKAPLDVAVPPVADRADRARYLCSRRSSANMFRSTTTMPLRAARRPVPGPPRAAARGRRGGASNGTVRREICSTSRRGQRRRDRRRHQQFAPIRA